MVNIFVLGIQLAFALLHRMLNFIQGLQYYMSYEVLEPNWRQLEKKLSQVTTIDEVLARHTGVCLCVSVYFGSHYTFLYFIDFLDRCLKDCLLTNREVVELTNRLVQCCLNFANHMQVQVHVTILFGNFIAPISVQNP